MIKIFLILIQYYNFFNNYTIYEENNNYFILNKQINDLKSNKQISISNQFQKLYNNTKILDNKINFNKIISLNNIIKNSSNLDIIPKNILFYTFNKKLFYFNYSNNKIFLSKILINCNEKILNFELYFDKNLFILLELEQFVEIYKYDLKNEIILKQNTLMKSFKNYELLIIYDNLYLLYENNKGVIELSKIEKMNLINKLKNFTQYKYYYLITYIAHNYIDYLLIKFKFKNFDIIYKLIKNKNDFVIIGCYEELNDNDFKIIKVYYNNNLKTNFLIKTKDNNYFNMFFNNFLKIDLNLNYDENIYYLGYIKDEFIILNKNDKFFEINLISKKIKNNKKIVSENLKFIWFDYFNQYFMFFDKNYNIITFNLFFIQGTKIKIDSINDLNYKICYFKDNINCKKQFFKNHLNLFINKLNIDNYYLDMKSKYSITWEINNVSNYFFIENIISGFINDIWIQKTHNFLNKSICDINNNKINFLIFKYWYYNFFLKNEIKDINIIKKNKTNWIKIIFLNKNNESFSINFRFNLDKDFNKNLILNFEKYKKKNFKSKNIIEIITCNNKIFYLLKKNNNFFKIYSYSKLKFDLNELLDYVDFFCNKDKLFLVFKNINNKYWYKIIYFKFTSNLFYNLYINYENFKNYDKIKNIYLLDNFLIEYYENIIIIRLVLIDNELIIFESTKLINLKDNDIVYINKELSKILIIKMNSSNYIDSINEYDLNDGYDQFFNNITIFNLSRKYDYSLIDKTLKINYFSNKINIFKFLILKNKNNDYFWLDFDKMNRLIFHRSNILDNTNYNLNFIEKTFEFKVKHLNKDFYIYIIKKKNNFTIFMFFNSFLWIKNLNLYYKNLPWKNNNIIFDEYLLIQNNFKKTIKLLNIKVKLKNNFWKINKDEKYLLTGFILYYFKGNNSIIINNPIIFLKNNKKLLNYKKNYFIIKKFYQQYFIYISKINNKYFLYLIDFYENINHKELIIKNNKFKYKIENLIIENENIKIYFRNNKNFHYLKNIKLIDLKNDNKINLNESIDLIGKIIYYKNCYFIFKNHVKYYSKNKIFLTSIWFYKNLKYFKIFLNVNGRDYLLIVLKEKIYLKMISINEKKSEINFICYLNIKNNVVLNIIYMFEYDKFKYLLSKNNEFLILYKIINKELKKINEIDFKICNKVLNIKKFKENNFIIACKSDLENIYLFNFKFDNKLILLMFYITEILEYDIPFDMTIIDNKLYISSSIFIFKIFEINEKIKYKILNKDYDEIKINASNNFEKNSVMVKNYINKFQLFVRHFIRNKWFVSLFIGGIVIFYLLSLVYLYFHIF